MHQRLVGISSYFVEVGADVQAAGLAGSYRLRQAKQRSPQRPNPLAIQLGRSGHGRARYGDLDSISITADTDVFESAIISVGLFKYSLAVKDASRGNLDKNSAGYVTDVVGTELNHLHCAFASVSGAARVG